MEQRKVLLIIISITVILAATIGVGLLLFYPRDEAPEATAETEFWDPMDFLTGSGSRPGLTTETDATDERDGTGGAEVGEADEADPSSDDGPFSVTYGVVSDSRDAAQPAATITESPVDDQPSSVTAAQQTAPPRETPAVSRPAQATEPTRSAPARTSSATTERTPTITEEPTLAARAYWVQLISSPNRDTVEQAQRSLGEHQVHTRIQTKEIGDTIYFRLRLGPFSVREEAEKFLDWILESDRFADALIFVDYTTSVRAPSGS